MSPNVTIEAKIRDIALRIVERFAPERVVLFGSHARGDADAGSDVDLLNMPPEVFAYEPMTGRAEWTQQPTHCRSGFCKALTEPRATASGTSGS
jgi:hypothetical protein